MVRRNTFETYVKFRNCELIAQKKYPWIAKKFNQTPEKLVLSQAVKAAMGNPNKRVSTAGSPRPVPGKISMI